MEGDPSVVSVVLLPSAVESKKLCVCSAAFNEVGRNDFVLDGVARLPHLTVAQFEMPVAAAGDLWEQVRRLSGLVTELRSDSICAAPNSAGDKLWILLQFLRSAKLDRLQQQVMSAEIAQRYKALTEQGDAYNPHITLGRTAGTVLPPLDLAQFDLFRRNFTDLTLAIGQNGEGMTLAKVLYH